MHAFARKNIFKKKSFITKEMKPKKGLWHS